MKRTTLDVLFPELGTYTGLMVIVDPDRVNVWIRPDAAHMRHFAGLLRASPLLTSYLIGGSSGITDASMELVARRMKDAGYPKRKIGLVPSSDETFTDRASWVALPICLNARQEGFQFEFVRRCLETIDACGLRVVPTAYLLVGEAVQRTTVGRVLNPDLIVSSKKLGSYLATAQLLGLETLSLEAGSGAPYSVDPELVRFCRTHFPGMITVGGGIKAPDQARSLWQAGANVLIIGDAVEKAQDPFEFISSIADAMPHA